MLLGLLTYLLTLWSRVLLEKLTSSQLVKKLSAFDGTQKFTTLFTSDCQVSLSEPDKSSPRSSITLPKDPA